MNMVLNYLQYLGYILIFPGFLFCFVAGLLLCGFREDRDRRCFSRSMISSSSAARRR